MDEQEMNVATAEWCGWKWWRCEELKTTSFHPESAVVVGAYKWTEIPRPENWRTIAYYGPKYASDLNAMHEVEKGLESPEYRGNEYAAHVEGILERDILKIDPDCVPDVVGFEMIHASARQRDEALLRTVGLWRD